MRYSPPALVSERRRSARSLTLRPRYSVRMAALALPSRSFTSSTTATFSGRGFSKSVLLLVGRAGMSHFQRRGAPDVYGRMFSCPRILVARFGSPRVFRRPDDAARGVLGL